MTSYDDEEQSMLRRSNKEMQKFNENAKGDDFNQNSADRVFKSNL